MIALEHKTDVLLIKLRSIFLVQLVYGEIEEVVLSVPTAVVHSENVENSGFSSSGGAHDRDELPLFDIQVDAAEDKRFRRTVLVIFFDVSERDHQFVLYTNRACTLRPIKYALDLGDTAGFWQSAGRNFGEPVEPEGSDSHFHRTNLLVKTHPGASDANRCFVRSGEQSEPEKQQEHRTDINVL